jgi:aspartate racemase
MGPSATVDLMARVIAATPAQDDSEHIRMLVDHNPNVPSRIKALIEMTGPSPAPVLINMAKGLATAGAQCLAMPCNTAHFYYQDIASAVDIPLLNMIHLVSEKVLQCIPKIQTVGILCSTAVKDTALYESSFSQHNIVLAYPASEGQDIVMALIKAVKANGLKPADISALNQQVTALELRGVECLVIACTELSVVADQIQTSLPIFDASQVLAEEIVRLAKP